MWSRSNNAEFHLFGNWYTGVNSAFLELAEDARLNIMELIEEEAQISDLQQPEIPGLISNQSDQTQNTGAAYCHSPTRGCSKLWKLHLRVPAVRQEADLGWGSH